MPVVTPAAFRSPVRLACGWGTLLLLALGLFGGCEVLPSPPDPPPDVLQQKMLDGVNAFRAKGRDCGDRFFPAAPPLRWDPLLTEAAVKHVRDMAFNDHYGHTGTDGSDAGERIEAVGYRWAAWGENVAKGQPSIRRVLDAWIKSPSHCAAIMSTKYTEMGAAVQDLHWAQVFARPALF